MDKISQVEDSQYFVRINKSENALTIKMGNRHINLVANFGNLSRLQAFTGGMSEYRLMNKILAIECNVHEIASIISCLIEQSDNRMTINDIGEFIVSNHAYFDFIMIAGTAVGLALDDGSNPDDRPKKKSTRTRSKNQSQ